MIEGYETYPVIWAPGVGGASGATDQCSLHLVGFFGLKFLWVDRIEQEK